MQKQKEKGVTFFCGKPLLSFGVNILHEEYHWKQYTFFVNPLNSVSSEGCRKNRSHRTSIFVEYYINVPQRKVFLSSCFIGIFTLAFVNLDSSCKQEFKTMEILSSSLNPIFSFSLYKVLWSRGVPKCCDASVTAFTRFKKFLK